MKNLTMGLLLLTLYTAPAWSAEDVQTQQAKAVMGNVYESYVHLIPYIYSQGDKLSELKDLKKKDELIKYLGDLSTAFKSAKHADFFQRPGFRPSLETMNEHIDETILSVQSGNNLFTQKRLNALGTLCVSCHSQIPESMAKSAFGKNISSVSRDKFDSDFSYGSYLYLVRQFEEASKVFEKAINDELNKRSTPYSRDVFASLRKILSVPTKIKFDYKAAQEFVKKWKNDQRLTNSDRKIIVRWGQDLEKWKTFNPDLIKSIPDFIQKNLSPLDMKKDLVFTGEEDVTMLISMGVLQNFLTLHPETKLAPEILYWLSLGERRLNQTYFFSLADLYLKDCIRRFPASPYAKKCYQEYSDSIEAGYSGSAGTDIPPEEKRELAKLKALLK